MTLRRQLLLVALLLLSLPWAGCQFIREMEGALRAGQAQSLEATAQAVAGVLGQRPELLYPHPARLKNSAQAGRSVYAQAATEPIFVDGYAEGWDDIAAQQFASAADEHRATLRARSLDDTIYLLLQVSDAEVIYHNPGLSEEANGDRLALRLWREGRRQDYVIATAAPGKVKARAAGRRHPDIDLSRIHGYWQDARGGYTLELALPLDYTGDRLGFYLVDESRRRGRSTRHTGNMSPLDPAAPPWLIYTPTALQELLTAFAQPGGAIQVLDREGWIIGAGDAAAQDSTGANSDTFWLLRLLYRSVLSRDELPVLPPPGGVGRFAGQEAATALAGKAASLRYRDPQAASRTVLSAAVPIGSAASPLGAVVVRQSAETYLSLTDQAFSRLLSYSLLALGVGAAGLLGFASLLSWRIRRLARAASRAIGDNGTVNGDFPRSRARDEIGDLSRHYADLLLRVRDYNEYLRTLSRKLAHELRTPIAVIQSSLDNLEQTDCGTAEGGPYLERARQGLGRLQRILTAMSEATRLEESIRQQEVERIDLGPLLRGMFEAYRSIYDQQRLLLELPPGPMLTAGASDLIVQALDKLMENAASFCPEGGHITLRVVRQQDEWKLSLSNQGPSLPEGMAEQLFEPMVSRRGERGDAVHLGLGLHIVRLIVDFHGGRVKAYNRSDHDGVTVTLWLPLAN